MQRQTVSDNAPLDNVIKYLPERIARAVAFAPEELLSRAQEIRLRRGGPLSVTSGAESYTLDCNGRISPLRTALMCSRQDIDECVARLCNGSYHSQQDNISKGFISAGGGIRAGVCGEADSVERLSVSTVTSVSLRISRYIFGAGQPVVNYIKQNGPAGLLLFSRPGAGKTTMLRDAAAALSAGRGLDGALRVSVVDERRELYVQGMDGGLLDVLFGYPKAQGIEIAARTLNAQIVVCDEISAGESEAICDAQNCGVPLIASAHASSGEELVRRPWIKRLLQSGIFSACYDISGGTWHRAEELL